MQFQPLALFEEALQELHLQICVPQQLRGISNLISGCVQQCEGSQRDCLFLSFPHCNLQKQHLSVSHVILVGCTLLSNGKE